MEWVFWTGVLPRVVEVDAASVLGVIAFATALLPAGLVARAAVASGLARVNAPRLRVFTGRRELSRNPA